MGRCRMVADRQRRGAGQVSQPDASLGAHTGILAGLMVDRTIDEALDSERTGGRLQNVRNGLELDIGSEQAWERWEGEVRRAASGGLGGTDPQEALFEGLIMGASVPSASS